LQYTFEQVIFSDNRIFTKSPEPPNSPSGRVAVIAHVFYLDLYYEIVKYLNHIEIPFDFYVTVPSHMEEEELTALFAAFPKVTVYKTENRGRDVLPFLQTMRHLGLDRYEYICKLHTKKTGDSPLGHVWRKLLYFDLIGSAETVTQIVDMMDHDATIGEITGKYTILDSVRYTYGNNTKVKRLCTQGGIDFPKQYTFAGGTMFWTRASLIEPVIRLFEEGKLEFEAERGQKDHTLAHALERFFGIIIQGQQKRIVPSPASYEQLPTETIEQTAALVLSQQYAGQDVYEKINELNDYIHNLEALVESMRLKNRLKRLPSDIVQRFSATAISSEKVFSSLQMYTRKIVDKLSPSTLRTLFTSLRNNPAILKKVWYYLKRGEFKYLLERLRIKLNNNLKTNDQFIPLDPASYFEPFEEEKFTLPNETRIDIIIPVYNGYEYLKALFDTIEANTSHSHRLIVIDDASPDERVNPYLKTRLKNHTDALFTEQKENLGFVRSVVAAVEKTEGHFVILNTDTEVPPLWLERLMHPIFNLPKVASTTPFTNAGTIASFPNFLEDNEIFEGMEVNKLDAHFMEVKAQTHYIPMPTGIGFCMGVNKTLVDRIGFFDTETFGKGYGEENDWCQRAIKTGYQNLLVPNLFVYHKHGGSLPSKVKQKLLEENHAKLLQKHPEYDKQVQAYIANDPHKILRQLIVMRASSYKQPLWVMFDHALGGGANLYAQKVLEEKQQNGENTLYVQYDFYSGTYHLTHRYDRYHARFSLDSLHALDYLLQYLKIGTLFLNSLVSYKHAQDVVEYLNALTQEQEIELIVPIHDFYPICPSYTLLDDTDSYCGMPDEEACLACMSSNQGEWRNFHGDVVDIVAWRDHWGTLLDHATKILCFSDASLQILQRAFPDLSVEKIKITPHKVEDIEPLTLPPRSPDAPLTIGILGAINHAKGASVIKEMVEIIDRDKLNMRVVVIGQITEQISNPSFAVTGKYARKDLPALIQKHRIDLFLIPSIWPETFSYTSEEIMQMQLPLMVFDLGAPAERVKHYDKGYIISKINAQAVLEKAMDIYHYDGKRA